MPPPLARVRYPVNTMNEFSIDFGEAPAPTDPQHTACTALCDTLIEGRKALVVQSLAQTSVASSAPVKAFLLLESWADNELADELLDRYPELARMRHAVPDELFKNREDEAPCLVPLSGALNLCTSQDSARAASAREDFVQWLMSASKQAQQRHVGQPFCGVIFSRAEPETVVRHWESLGNQRPPDGGSARLFRYQDPRVMQRVWPLLTANQKQHWLGPVMQWWSLAQPWGPWDPGELASPAAATQAAWIHVGKPSFFNRQSDATRSHLAALLTPVQWQAAHLTPNANRVWQGYAADGVAAAQQPDGDTVARLLADAMGLGLVGPSLQDYVWCTWRHAAPAGTPREAPWKSGAGLALMQKILKVLKAQPDARFASVYANLTQPRQH